MQIYRDFIDPMMRIDADVSTIAKYCIDNEISPFDLIDNKAILAAVIFRLDEWVESGEIEDLVPSLHEIMMVIDWIDRYEEEA